MRLYYRENKSSRKIVSVQPGRDSTAQISERRRKTEKYETWLKLWFSWEMSKERQIEATETSYYFEKIANEMNYKNGKAWNINLRE